jgi:(4S)-4-hydroxy-5-phosphonooxypentane-2,3-dione isomerase
MVIVLEFVEAHPPQRAQLRAALLVLAHSALQRHRGCIQFDVGQDDLDGSAFLLYQVYETKADHIAHLEQAEYQEHRTLTDAWTQTRRILTYEHISGAGVA